nr:ATP-binding protein [uncultured Flavobacterium sp.]
MKKKLLYLVFLITLGLHAQDNWPETFRVSNDSVEYAPLAVNYWQYVSIGKDSVPFKTVTAPGFEKKFKFYEKTEQKNSINVNLGIEKSDYAWVRFKLANTGTTPVQVGVRVFSKRATYYFGQNGKWEQYTTGYMVPRNKKDGIKRFDCLLYTIPPQTEVTVYACYSNNNEVEALYPRLVNYNAFVKNIFHDEAVYGLDDIISAVFFGFIFFAVVFNMLFFYVNRERVYLVYSITLLVAAMVAGGSVINLAFFSDNPLAGNSFQAFFIIALIIMVIQTVRLFFRIKEHYPRWDRFLLWAPVVIFILGFMLSILPKSELKFKAATVVGLVSFAVIITFIIGSLVMLIAFLRKKNKEARLFVVAALPFSISLLLTIFTDYDFSVLLSSIWAIGVLSWGLFARFKDLQIENARVALEKEEERNRIIAHQNELLEQQVAERTAELTKSLEDLKQTQAQLIQSEKMASLGELTAGIAHEIQNPLNFVNNFSDVSKELVEEMEEELQKGDTEEAIAIATDIKQNLEKIAHHGRRADSIVKGMLQHSRTSSGQKEPTDINALADEYLRLAYHGLRAKDKSFNAELITDFDSSLPKVEVLAQDFGRVLLNMFTNAFYATQQKVKSPPPPKGGETAPYKPAVSVTTKLVDGAVEIRVKDNGTGIPDAIKDKILQPFFTTKPTGEGTGLGLSLSYDIVVKTHGGTIDIDSIEGEYTEFIIRIK